MTSPRQAEHKRGFWRDEFCKAQAERRETIAHFWHQSAKGFRWGATALGFVLRFSWRLLRDATIETKRQFLAYLRTELVSRRRLK